MKYIHLSNSKKEEGRQLFARNTAPLLQLKLAPASWKLKEKQFIIVRLVYNPVLQFSRTGKFTFSRASPSQYGL